MIKSCYEQMISLWPRSPETVLSQRPVKRLKDEAQLILHTEGGYDGTLLLPVCTWIIQPDKNTELIEILNLQAPQL